MKHVPRLHVVLRRSRRAAMWFVAPTAATALLLLALPWPWWALLIADLALVAWAYGMWRRLMPQGLPGGVEALTLSADRQLRLYFADETAEGASASEEEGLSARVLDDTCLGDAFITFVWRREGSHRLKRSQTLFLLPDMMSADDWRRLRVLLQHGREMAIQESGSTLRQSE
ncbi:MAG: hypothetical protein LBI35_05935 [Burkholderiales bacterium]|jgi:hypothetical protein|nr:hypothetical protein [Burkholderiales bacterium]